MLTKNYIGFNSDYLKYGMLVKIIDKRSDFLRDQGDLIEETFFVKHVDPFFITLVNHMYEKQFSIKYFVSDPEWHCDPEFSLEIIE